VEVVDHQRRCGQHVTDRGGVTTECIDRRDVDAVSPPARLRGHPLPDDRTRPACDDIAKPAPVDVEEGGRHLRPAVSVGDGVLEGVLIDAQPRGALEPAVSGDELVAVVDHRLMGTGPTDPERTGHRRHAVELFTERDGRPPGAPAP
jgi:hypothetical protein